MVLDNANSVRMIVGKDGTRMDWTGGKYIRAMVAAGCWKLTETKEFGIVPVV